MRQHLCAAASSTTSTTIGCTWAYIVGLDYQDPRLKPFEAFQQYKNHPDGERRCSRAARFSPPAHAPSRRAAGNRRRRSRCRARCWSAMPGARSTSPRSRAVHQAIRSGMLAGEHTSSTLDAERRIRCAGGARRQAASELRSACAISSPAFKRGCGSGSFNSALGNARPFGANLAVDAEEHADFSAAETCSTTMSPRRTGEWGERTLPPRDRVSFRLLRRQRTTMRIAAHPSEGGGHLDLRHPLHQGIRQPLRELLSRGCVRNGRRRRRRRGGCRSTPPTACTARPATSRNRTTDQITWVDARGRFGPELPEPVARHGWGRAAWSSDMYARHGERAHRRGGRVTRSLAGGSRAIRRRRARSRRAARPLCDRSRRSWIPAWARLFKRTAPNVDFISGAASAAARRCSWTCSSAALPGDIRGGAERHHFHHFMRDWCMPNYRVRRSSARGSARASSHGRIAGRRPRALPR